MKKLYKIVFGTPEGKRPLGKCRYRWVDNIEMYLKEIRLEWIYLAQNRDDLRGLLKAAMSRKRSEIY